MLMPNDQKLLFRLIVQLKFDCLGCQVKSLKHNDLWSFCYQINPYTFGLALLILKWLSKYYTLNNPFKDKDLGWFILAGVVHEVVDLCGWVNYTSLSIGHLDQKKDRINDQNNDNKNWNSTTNSCLQNGVAFVVEKNRSCKSASIFNVNVF